MNRRGFLRSLVVVVGIIVPSYSWFQSMNFVEIKGIGLYVNTSTSIYDGRLYEPNTMYLSAECYDMEIGR